MWSFISNVGSDHRSGRRGKQPQTKQLFFDFYCNRFEGKPRSVGGGGVGRGEERATATVPFAFLYCPLFLNT